MVKILSQSGITLADVYNVVGSIAGIDQLESREVSLVHEMGATIFSERLTSQFVRMTSTDSLQNTEWSVTSGVVPDAIARILGISVFIPLAAIDRIDDCMVSIQNGVTDREIPIMTWDDLVDPQIRVRWSDDGQAVANFLELRSSIDRLPSLMTRLDIPRGRLPVLRFRGSTAGFGAGTVEAIAIIYVVRASDPTPVPGRPSSHGLPIPGW